MSNFERTTSWQQIQQGVKEAERLIVSKDYNLVMRFLMIFRWQRPLQYR